MVEVRRRRRRRPTSTTSTTPTGSTASTASTSSSTWPPCRRDLPPVAAAADSDFSKNIFKSYIQGIPFAIKDTYDLAGHATAYGSWEYLDNVVDTESPLVTYALQAGAVPLFKSSVPQLTWGFANFNGTTYSCLNGGYSAGAGSSGGSSIGSGTAVCLGVVPISICEQTGSSCQAPAIATASRRSSPRSAPSLGEWALSPPSPPRPPPPPLPSHTSHFSIHSENNGLYSMESDRPASSAATSLSCASSTTTCAASRRATRRAGTCPSKIRRRSTSRASRSASSTTPRPPAGRRRGTRRSRGSAAT